MTRASGRAAARRAMKNLLRVPPPAAMTSSGGLGRKRRYWCATESAEKAVTVATMSASWKPLVRPRCRMARPMAGLKSSRPVVLGGSSAKYGCSSISSTHASSTVPEAAVAPSSSYERAPCVMSVMSTSLSTLAGPVSKASGAVESSDSGGR